MNGYKGSANDLCKCPNLFLGIYFTFYKEAYRIIRIERISILIRMIRHLLIHMALIAVL
jgi:hypothetical protein